MLQVVIMSELTGVYSNVTVYYKQKMTFFNAKFDQICPKISAFLPFAASKMLIYFLALPS